MYHTASDGGLILRVPEVASIMDGGCPLQVHRGLTGATLMSSITGPNAAPLVLANSMVVRAPDATKLTVIFGRNEPDVHVRVGAGDREHLLEVRVTGPAPTGASGVQFDDTTHYTGTIWELSDREQLVLVALGQRYLRHEAYPQPLSWSNVAKELTSLQPGEGWSSDACAVLDTTALSRVAGLDSPGSANWSCTWGAASNGSPRVSLWFRLDDASVARLRRPHHDRRLAAPGIALQVGRDQLLSVA